MSFYDFTSDLHKSELEFRETLVEIDDQITYNFGIFDEIVQYPKKVSVFFHSRPIEDVYQ